MKSKKSKSIKEWIIFALPGCFVFFMVVMIPFFYGFYLTLTDWNGISAEKNIVGLANYAAVMKDAEFWQSMFLTLSRAFMVYDVNLTLTGGEPYGTTRLVAMYVHDKAFNSRAYGIGQSEALVLFVIVALISAAQIYIGKKKEIEA